MDGIPWGFVLFCFFALEVWLQLWWIHKCQLWWTHKCWLHDWIMKIDCMLDSQVLTAWLNHENQLHVGFTPLLVFSTDCVTAWLIHKNQLHTRFISTDCVTVSRKSPACSIHWLQDWFTKINCMLDSWALTMWLIHKKSAVCLIHKCWLQDWFTKINFMLDSILTAWPIHKNQLRAQFTSTDGRTDSLKSTVCQILQH